MAEQNNKRKHPRLVHRAKVLVIYSDEQSEQLQMNDFSQTGMFIGCAHEKLPALGDSFHVQSLEIDDAPVLRVSVTRLVPGQGFAVEFIDESAD